MVIYQAVVLLPIVRESETSSKLIKSLIEKCSLDAAEAQISFEE